MDTGEEVRLPDGKLADTFHIPGLNTRLSPDGTRTLVADSQQVGVVRVPLRDPQGRSLINTAVVLEPSVYQDTTRFLQFSGTTDADGWITLPLPCVIQALRISVPGIGMGQTGIFEVKPGSRLNVQLPPLGAFASVEGTLDKTVPQAQGRAACYIAFGFRGRVNTDSSGHFIIHDLPPGGCTINYISDDGRHQARAGVDLLAGRTVHVTLTGDEEIGSTPESISSPATPDQKITASELVGGVVHTSDRHPAQGVTVTAIDPEGEVFGAATTDNAGRYLIRYKGTGERNCVLVFQPTNHAHRIIPRILGATPGNPTPVLNYDLGGLSGTLEIKVNRDGRPAVGFFARLYAADIWRTGYDGSPLEPAVEHQQQRLFPVQKTDIAGVTTFKDLQAGAYDVFIYAPDQSIFDAQCLRGIRVKENQTTRLAVAARTVFGELPLHFWLAGEQRLSNVNIQRFVRSVNAALTGYWDWPFFRLDLYHQRWREAGLLTLDYRYQETRDPIRIYPVAEPLYQASATAAASRLIPHLKPIDITFARHLPASLLVQLQDVGGNPAHGTVMLHNSMDDPGPTATTDRDGRVLFEGLPSADYPVYSQLDGMKPVPDAALSVPDSVYTGISVLPTLTVRAMADQHLQRIVRQQLVGYVRGTITPPAGHSPAEYEIFHRIIDHRLLTSDGGEYAYPIHEDVVLDGKSGQFIVGPLKPGHETFRLVRKGSEEGATFAAGDQGVDIRPGAVTHVDFRPAQVSGSERYISWPYYGSGKATVFYADGKTPADGARVEVYVPEMWFPYMTGVADSAGNAFISGVSGSGGEPKRQPPGSPTSPVIVAWLPATCGAIVKPCEPFAKDIRLILPSPISFSGHVTVGGNSPEHLGAIIHVLAAHESAGKLERAMNIRTTCSSDGSFELPGLTPGKYRVQAALDDVWLSKTIEVDAREGTPLAPLSLNIDPPGVGVSIHLLGPKWPQTPSPRIAIERPSGPLTEELWPKDFEADGAGLVYLEGLEAGRHTMILPGGRRESFDVPPSDEEHRVPIDVNAPLMNPK